MMYGGRTITTVRGLLPYQDHAGRAADYEPNTRRTSQTDVMLIILPKGQEGVDRFQKAVYQRTIGIWTGKDSRQRAGEYGAVL